MIPKAARLHLISWLLMIPLQVMVVIASMFVLSKSAKDFDMRLTLLFATAPWKWFMIGAVILLGYWQSWFVLRRIARSRRADGSRLGTRGQPSRIERS